MFGRARRALRIVITLVILAAAVIAGVGIWNHYVTGPWTRDGQVLANVVNLAPEASGRITKLYVRDNQTVHKGDPLFDIDPLDYQVNVATAQANVNSKLADLKLKQQEATRRTSLTTLSTSDEERQTYSSNADVAAAAYATALAQLSQAHINLDRTHVVSPVNGYVTNLLLREGDYATTGSATSPSWTATVSGSWGISRRRSSTASMSVTRRSHRSWDIGTRSAAMWRASPAASTRRTPTRARWAWPPSMQCSPGSGWPSVSRCASISITFRKQSVWPQA